MKNVSPVGSGLRILRTIGYAWSWSRKLENEAQFLIDTFMSFSQSEFDLLMQETSRTGFAIKEDGQFFYAIFTPILRMSLNVRARKKEFLFRMRAYFKRHDPVFIEETGDAVVARFSCKGRASGQKFKLHAYRQIAMIRKTPLTPKMVCESLEITSQLRKQWSLDGRLRKSGQGVFGSNERKGFYDLYSARHIENLLMTPDILTVWRNENLLSN